ncbi:MAG: hypothetical protein AAFZ80_01700 [Cyanobacteria bacterium P01_A01_bin.105]
MLTSFVRAYSSPGRWTPWLRGLTLATLMLLAGCQAVSGLPNVVPGGDLVLLSLDSVEPMPQLGSYQVSGTTQFADQTPLTILALRRVQTGNHGNAAPFYSILDRQRVSVAKGQWSTQLQLLQTNPGGGEQWQAEAAHSPLPWQPESEVIFSVTLDPSQQTAALHQQLSNNQQGFESGAVRVSDDGELYAIATETITIEPPQWDAPPFPVTEQPTTRVAEPSQTQTPPTPPNAPPLPPNAALR